MREFSWKHKMRLDYVLMNNLKNTENNLNKILRSNFLIYSLSQYKDILYKEQVFTLSARQLSIIRIKYGNKEDAVFVIRIAILKSY